MPTNERKDRPHDRLAYYQEMRALARAKRALYGVQTDSLDLRVIRSIYKAEGITIDLWDVKGKNIRASYFCEDDDYSVLINKNLPRTPKLFALTHELKHHYWDQEIIKGGVIRCGDYNKNELIEKGAEVFAAEFIYPELEMRALASKLVINQLTCTPEKIVEFKRECSACISYTFIVKRFERFGFIKKGVYVKVHFQKLEEEIYGPPIYKQAWFKERRAKRNTHH